MSLSREFVVPFSALEPLELAPELMLPVGRYQATQSQTGTPGIPPLIFWSPPQFAVTLTAEQIVAFGGPPDADSPATYDVTTYVRSGQISLKW